MGLKELLTMGFPDAFTKTLKSDQNGIESTIFNVFDESYVFC